MIYFFPVSVVRMFCKTRQIRSNVEHIVQATAFSVHFQTLLQKYAPAGSKSFLQNLRYLPTTVAYLIPLS